MVEGKIRVNKLQFSAGVWNYAETRLFVFIFTTQLGIPGYFYNSCKCMLKTNDNLVSPYTCGGTLKEKPFY